MCWGGGAVRTMCWGEAGEQEMDFPDVRFLRPQVEELKLKIKDMEEKEKRESKKLADEDALKKIKFAEEQIEHLQKKLAATKQVGGLIDLGGPRLGKVPAWLRAAGCAMMPPVVEWPWLRGERACGERREGGGCRGAGHTMSG